MRNPDPPQADKTGAPEPRSPQAIDFASRGGRYQSKRSLREHGFREPHRVPLVRRPSATPRRFDWGVALSPRSVVSQALC